MRRLALSLPGVEENGRGERPSYGVASRRFATCARKRRSLVLKLSPREQQVLTRVRPAEFAPASPRSQGWTRIDLRRVDTWLLEELVVAAWRRVAPKRQAAAWDAARTAASMPRRRAGLGKR